MVKIKEEYHLSIGAVTAPDGMSDPDKSSAFVWKQEPSFGRKIHVGEEIDLWIAKEMPDNITVHPEYYNSATTDTIVGGE